MMDLSSLNPQQRMAVEAVRGPVLVLAGAGTGKTRVITTRIVQMIRKRVPPGSVLAVTFTNKAAREMAERVRALLGKPRRAANGEKEERPTICTFHSLCVRILRQHIEKLGYKRNFVIYDESDQLGVLKKILSRISDKEMKSDPREVLGLLSRVRNMGSGTCPGMTENARAFVEHVGAQYESSLRACNAVDFDDLILLVLKLFKEHPEALDACRQKYQYVMVDEYQDTNLAQFELVRALTEKHRNLCVVGDDDQSIYGWRGAEIANLLDLEAHYPEVRVVKLEQNYRSTNTILQAANAVIRNNARRRPKQLWSAKGRGSNLILQAFEDEEKEAQTVVEQIEYRRQILKIPWAAQAVLFRTNQQSRPLETALRKASIRYNLIGGQSFFDRREVKDLMAYLRVMVNPKDDSSLLRIANVPARGLSDLTMERLLAASHERRQSVFEAMKNPVVQCSFQTKAREAIAGFAGWIEEWRKPLLRQDGLSLAAWGNSLMGEIRYAEELRRSEKDEETAENRVRNVKEMIGAMDAVGGDAAEPMERLQTFLEELTLDTDRISEKERESEAVTLITVHSCKGLEFPHVYLVGVEEDLIPHVRSKEDAASIDEERRLFYVAITRAKESLMITHCHSRKKFGQGKPCHPSRFLKELPEELVEWVDGKERKAATVDEGKQFFSGLRALVGEGIEESPFP